MIVKNEVNRENESEGSRECECDGEGSIVLVSYGGR